jgi:ketosteroid isomerase-like protein
MSEHPNAALVRHMGEAMSHGDMATAAATLADDVVWHEIGRPNPLRGKEELRGGMSGGDYEITYVIHDVVANDDHAVALGEATATRQGRRLTYRTAEIYHVRDGKIVERWAFSDDTAAILAFFA